MKKKLLALAMAQVLVFSLAACGSSDSSDEAEETVEEETEEAAEEEEAEEEAEETVEEEAEEESDVEVMSYDEYAAADLESEVVIEAYVQAKQSWWDDSAVIYAQDEDGAYFIYSLTCTEEQYDEELTTGTKIRVTGYKTEWSGEVEITDATYELVEDAEEFIADPVDATDLIGDEEALEEIINQKVSFTGVTVVAQEDGSAFLYAWDGSGSADSDSDLYFTVATEDGEELTLVVEYYLCGPDTDAYQAVQGLSVGDVIDIEGFLYWYEGAQPHVTSVTVQ